MWDDFFRVWLLILIFFFCVIATFLKIKSIFSKIIINSIEIANKNIDFDFVEYEIFFYIFNFDQFLQFIFAFWTNVDRYLMFVLTIDIFVKFVLTFFYVVIIRTFFAFKILLFNKTLMNVMIIISITKILSKFAIAYISFRFVKIIRVIEIS